MCLGYDVFHKEEIKMKAILGYAFMITISTFLLILDVAVLFIKEEIVWLDLLPTIFGVFNLFIWTADALYNLNHSNTGDKDETLD